MLQRNTDHHHQHQQHQQSHPGDRKSHQMALVVLLLSCSLTRAVVSGSDEAISGVNQPEVTPEGSMVEPWNGESMQFLRQFVVSVVKEAMLTQGIRCESAADQELKVLRLIEEAVQLRKDLEQGLVETGGPEAVQGVARGRTSSSKEDGKRSGSADVVRDHKLKTLFRWGKRRSSSE